MEKFIVGRQATDDNIIGCIHFACWITRATNSCSKYVILIDFSWQQWLCEHASSYAYIACLNVEII
jgi:hypothetical protein